MHRWVQMGNVQLLCWCTGGQYETSGPAAVVLNCGCCDATRHLYVLPDLNQKHSS